METTTEDSLPCDTRVANCVEAALDGLSTAYQSLLAIRAIFSTELPKHEKGLVVPNDSLPAYVTLHWFITELDMMSEVLEQTFVEGIAKQETETKE